ncbi:BrxE family protein [Taklimakanibacter deserti]|uniref:BrxE family protein n=1 Tax=Taklimakanibacter deserti TaxID=2267839 RepID=UPI000E649332
MPSSPVQILKLRQLVGFLGERAQFGWWPTAFYEPSGRLFLEPIFSKTPQVAQYHGVVEAARRLHDEHLSIGAYHLFRLTEEIEQDLHVLVQTAAEEWSPAVLYRDKQTALAALTDLTSAAKKDGVGPISIGDVRNIAGLLRDIASVYRSAFLSGTPSFPYLAG